MAPKKKEAANETAQKTTEQEQEQKNILLGTISYTNDEDYENFLSKLDVNQAMFVLIASANYAQAKGLYNLDESELVAKAIKKIKRSSAQAAPADAEPVASEDTKS